MNEILLTSSVLILAILGVRFLFRNAISRRLQYALWGLVLVRLLLPFQLPAMEHNVLTATAPMQKAIETEMEERMIYALPTKVTPVPGLGEGEIRIDRTEHTNYRQLPNGDWKETSEYYSGGVIYEDGQVTRYQFLWPVGEFLQGIWFAGMAVMALWFLLANKSFYQKIRKARTLYSVDDCKYSVYLVEEGLPSPCLFGLVRPAIYLTPAAVRNEETMRHVLAHETTHARHFDPLWAFLRGVCLVIYWFDPLVWAAAYASRTDCELACDEGALKFLGESERISYGKTLLSLIPLQKNPASPLLSATTMTSDKKKLTDRIRRIAENRQTVHAALFAVIALSVMVSAVTFTGTKTDKGKTVPLTAEEIAWFNTEFFNGEPINVRNQFLSSDYESIDQIDVYELLYTGGGISVGIPGGDEKQELLNTYYGGTEPDCAGMKLPEGKVDALLLQHTGFLLSDLQAIGMGGFQYLAKYNAYYHYHGDTNYRSQVVIASGEKDGDLVRLYYYDNFLDAVWKCVTLRYREDVGTYEATFDPFTGKKNVSLISTAPRYHFVSNVPCNAPDGISSSQVILPSDDAEEIVKLNSITEVGPIEVSAPEADGTKVRRALGTAETTQVGLGAYTALLWTDESSGDSHFSYGRTDGNIGEATFYDIMVGPASSYASAYALEPFYNLLGHNGFVISYPAENDLQPSSNWNYTVRRYYDIKDGQLLLLATTVGGWDQMEDLDGDGIRELFFDSDYIRRIDNIYSFLFYRDGSIYGLNPQVIAQETYPHWEYVRTGRTENSCIPVVGSYLREDGAYVDAFRYLYFTGDEIRFYQDSRETVDHVMGTPDVSPEILSYAKEAVDGYYTKILAEEWDYDPEYDDWRIENLVHDKTYSFDGGEIEVYNLNFEFHAGNPAEVMLAGGMYHREDDWVMPSYPDCFYLYVLQQNGQQRLLDMRMINDCSPGIDLFDNDVYNMAMAEGLTTLAQLDGKALLQKLSMSIPSLLEEMTSMTPEEQKKVAEKICYYRTSGSEEDQVLYQNTMQALMQWNTQELTTAQYDAWLLLIHYHTCDPADLSDEERFAALEAAENHMRRYSESENCLSFELISAAIDPDETWRIVNMYTDSELAVSQGRDHETMTHLTAVKVVYDISWDHTKIDYDVEEGRSARYLYMLPDENGEWFVWDQRGCKTPELYELAIDALISSPTVALIMNENGYLTEMDNYWRIRVEDYPTDFVWNSKIKVDEPPSGNALTLADEEFGVSIKCWENLDLVCVTLHDETAWYTAMPVNTYAGFDGRLFSMIRQWYDDVEWQALVDGIVVEDRGQSHLEIATEWAERYAQAFLQVTSGSQYACTYARASAELWDWVPETAYPSITEGAERFYFGFHRIFVPETQHAYYYQMAGNTTDYDGSFGEAPEGACIDSRVGPMYKTEDGWRCVGVGTGI